MVLLDTCVLSELVRPSPEPAVVRWVDRQDETLLYLSAITIGELARGVARLPESRRRTRLDGWLQEDLLPRFRGRILPLDDRVMLEWGRMVAALEQAGRSLPAMDSLIAATARYHDLSLVTRNSAVFEGTGVPLHNPWLPASRG